MSELCKGTNGNWKKASGEALLGGDYGTCFDISVLYDGEKISMYFSWRDRASIALVTSTDGMHWSEPVICLEPRETKEGWENHVNRPYVILKDGIYHMWYTGQYLPGDPKGSSYIFYATSRDGVKFERVSENPVLSPDVKWEKKALMCPSVLWDEKQNIYRMWYCGGEQYEPDAFGYAESADGINWKKYSGNPVFAANPALSWEQAKVGGCQVLYEAGKYYMFYIGYHDVHYAQIGMARSDDGISGWERSSLNPIIAPDENSWDADACYKPFAIKFNGSWYLWYNGRKEHHEQIGLAIQPGEKLEF